MKWTKPLFAILILVLFTGTAKAQKVEIKSIDNSTPGQLTVNVMVSGLGDKQGVRQVQVVARPPGGAAGRGGYKVAAPAGGGVYAGTMTGLTSGNTYDIQAIATITDTSTGKTVTRFIYSGSTLNQPVK